jgi:bifunctional non-homologous end joining protein LigD
LRLVRSASGKPRPRLGLVLIRLACSTTRLHEIKHDGFRIIARKNGERVRLYSRPGNGLTRRFSLIVEALVRLRSRSCIIDGGAVACDVASHPSPPG